MESLNSNFTEPCTIFLLDLAMPRIWFPMSCDTVFSNVMFMCENQEPSNSTVDLRVIGGHICSSGMVFVNDMCVYIVSNTISLSHSCHFSRKMIALEQFTPYITSWLKYRSNSVLFNCQHKECECATHNDPESSDQKTWYIKKEGVHCNDIEVCVRPASLHREFQPYRFQCDDGTFILLHYKCDRFTDCEDNSDELYCSSGFSGASVPDMFLCLSSESIPLIELCDLVIDCKDGSDEFYCIYVPPREQTIDCSVNCINKGDHCFGWADCAYDQSDSFCYPHDQICSFQRNLLGDQKYCPNTHHLNFCGNHQCPHMYKCPSSYCVPTYVVCDGIADCPNKEDEQDCEHFVCEGLLKCRLDNICVHPLQQCDGVLHCPMSRDDESVCPHKACPAQCLCYGNHITCKNTEKEIHLMQQQSLELISLTFDNVVFLLDKAILRNCPLLKVLILHYIQPEVTQVLTDMFVYQSRLLHISLRHNKISTIKYKAFNGLHNLRSIDLQHNPIKTINSYAFSTLSGVKNLDLSSIKIEQIAPNAFHGMKSLVSLSLSENLIHMIMNNMFSGLGDTAIDLRGNSIVELHGMLSGIGNHTIMVSDQAMCCAFLTKCSDNKNNQNSMNCNNILDKMYMTTLYLASAIYIMLVNVNIILNHREYSNKMFGRMQRLNNLSNLIPAFYLIAIAITNAILDNKLITIYSLWVRHAVCMLVNISLAYSIVTSHWLMVVSSFNILLIIRYPFKMQLSVRRQIIVVSLSMIVTAVYAYLWVMPTNITNITCFPIHVDNRTLSIITSVILFICIVVFSVSSYLTINHIIESSASASRMSKNRSISSRYKVLLRQVICTVTLRFLFWINVITIFAIQTVHLISTVQNSLVITGLMCIYGCEPMIVQLKTFRKTITKLKRRVDVIHRIFKKAAV